LKNKHFFGFQVQNHWEKCRVFIGQKSAEIPANNFANPGISDSNPHWAIESGFIGHPGLSQ